MVFWLKPLVAYTCFVSKRSLFDGNEEKANSQLTTLRLGEEQFPAVLDGNCSVLLFMNCCSFLSLLSTKSCCAVGLTEILALSQTVLVTCVFVSRIFLLSVMC